MVQNEERIAVKTKKNKKNMKSYWKVATLVFILNALFVDFVCASSADRGNSGAGPEKADMAVRVTVKDAETLDQLSLLRDELSAARKEILLLTRDGKTLTDEKQQIRKELIEILNRYKQRNESWNRLQLSVAATLASGKMRVVSAREDQLLRSLSSVSDSGRTLAFKSIEFCDYVDSFLEKMPLGNVERARIKLRIDELKKEAGRICTMTAAETVSKDIDRCRLLAVNDKLQIVVLPVGWVHGVRNGLILYTGKDNSCQLQVVTARPFISAAIVKTGDIKELAPGMVANVNVKSNIKK